MNSQSTKPKPKRWVRIGIAGLVLLLLGGEAVRRAVTGHGHFHALALTAYHKFKEARRERAREALGPVERAEAPLVIYDDTFQNDWVDWSWAERNSASTAHVFKGSHAIEMSPAAYKGLYLHHAQIGTAGFGTLQCYVFGTSDLNVSVVDGYGTFGKPVSLKEYRQTAPGLPDGWNIVRIPLTDLGLSRLGDTITGFVFQATTASAQPAISLDEISLEPDLSLPLPPTEATVAITIDTHENVHPISPYIYGMAFAPLDFMQDLRIPANRWGGNDKTRYNWVQGDADNAARDWRWANRTADSDGNPPPGPSSAADEFTRKNRLAGTATLLTVPTIGWVAIDADNGKTSVDVPAAGGPPLTTVDGAIAGYDPTENRKRTSLRSAAHNPSSRSLELDPTSTTIYQDQWIHHLVEKFGRAAQGGVHFYAMDNEPDIWDATHTDVHPARMGYDDMLANFLEYATAVKSVDPTAEVTGPVLSGWTFYLYSSLDRGNDNFHTHADCTKHGGDAFILWFLKQVKAHDTLTQKRTLDVLDIHFYPQGLGIFSGSLDRDTQTRRLRSTRALWDPEYTDESWIGEPLRLIPRLKEWIASGYPGTKIGITEWNFGGDQEINGALTIADVLGIYGREDVYLANYWAFPLKDSPGYQAFRLYRNADGHGNGFGDLACSAVSASQDRVACYAATDTKTGDLTLMLINKMYKATVTAPLTLKGWAASGGQTRSWLLSAAHPKELVPAAGPVFQSSRATISLPPSSITLVRVSAQSHP